ncbi:hypothetical protein E1263_36795 [Kribbella antibiotica]|uniref:Uncharacterized protein n=1 Tax=Kribbella antibiotica TaxID=190195 RepID=A0A4R4YMV4_9ACTN|nr:hypothetical protein [Kribbella antibiotica]TDD46336.1 hypothetical protein E1263_36795 [Kribbella antibiotica]
MDYEQFKVESDKVFAVLGDKDLPVTLADDIARLKDLAATVEDPQDRWDAEGDIVSIEGILQAGEGADEEPWSDAMNQAVQAHARATDDSGTPAERIARARAGITAISRIADTAPANEQAAIVEMNESLLMLAEALEPDAR